MKFVKGHWEYGKPSWEQTIRLLKIWNYEHPDKEPQEFTKENIKASQIAYQYRNWPDKLIKYKNVEFE